MSKRILAIHDLSGWGHTSLMTTIPIMYSRGIQVAVLPSAVLSTNTDYEGYRLLDLTDHMRQSIAHWKELKVSFDAIYSGFLASARQVEPVMDAILSFKKASAPVLIDPVLGDSGKLYSCYSPAMVAAMRRLLPLADILTPNLSEAALLLGREYDPTISKQELRAYCKALQDLGSKTVLITSALFPKDGYSAIYGLDANGEELYFELTHHPSACPGAGDNFSSMLLAGLLGGESLSSAVSRAAAFVAEGIRLSLEQKRDPKTGIALEQVLHLGCPPHSDAAYLQEG